MKDKRDKNATHTKCNEMQQTTKVKRDQSTNKMHPLNKLEEGTHHILLESIHLNEN